MSSTSPALDLAKYIDSDGFLTAGTDLFVAELGEPHKQLMIADGPGVTPALQDMHEQINITMLVRGSHTEGYPDVYAFAKSIYDYIINLGGPISLNGTCYQSFAVANPLQQLGKDDRNRFLLTMSWDTYRAF